MARAFINTRLDLHLAYVPDGVLETVLNETCCVFFIIFCHSCTVTVVATYVKHVSVMVISGT